MNNKEYNPDDCYIIINGDTVIKTFSSEEIKKTKIKKNIKLSKKQGVHLILGEDYIKALKNAMKNIQNEKIIKDFYEMLEIAIIKELRLYIDI